jgi:hypothetical protein
VSYYCILLQFPFGVFVFSGFFFKFVRFLIRCRLIAFSCHSDNQKPLGRGQCFAMDLNHRWVVVGTNLGMSRYGFLFLLIAVCLTGRVHHRLRHSLPPPLPDLADERACVHPLDRTQQTVWERICSAREFYFLLLKYLA